MTEETFLVLNAMPKQANQQPTPIGVVGLGLMGRGIAACLLSHGLDVVVYNRTATRVGAARTFIDTALNDLVRRKAARPAQIRSWPDRFHAVRSFKKFDQCAIVIESIKENPALKRRLFDQLEQHVSPAAVIASNTSSLPLMTLQKGRQHPARFVVMHWSEPAWITRFMEIIRNEQTAPETVRQAEQLALRCGKEPAVINFDIRGFIANRLMYAFIREACYLADLGVADIEMIDRSFRNDVGWWATLAGPFRWMDLTGIHSYAAVMEGLLPELANSQETTADHAADEGPQRTRRIQSEGLLSIQQADRRGVGRRMGGLHVRCSQAGREIRSTPA